MSESVSSGLVETSVTSGEIRVQHWDKGARTRRALKFLGYSWAGAVVSVIIPLVHFFLVPGLLIAGPVGAWIMLGQQSVVLGGEGSCPHCGKPLLIARGAYQFPMADVCTECRRDVTLERT